MLYLIDTCVFSDLAKPRANPKTLRKFTEHFEDVRLASVSLHEIRYGIELLPDGKRKETLREGMLAIISGVVVLPYDAVAAEWHATARARLVKTGETRSFVDGQIAATAAVNGCELVTSNMKDFRGLGVSLAKWA